MKIAFAADALSGFKIAKDSTYAMMVEAAARGHEIHAFSHADLMFDGGGVKAVVARVNLTGESGAWYRAEAPVLQPLNAFDAVIERTDPPFDMQYIYATYLLQRAEAELSQRAAEAGGPSRVCSPAQAAQFRNLDARLAALQDREQLIRIHRVLPPMPRAR